MTRTAPSGYDCSDSARRSATSISWMLPPPVSSTKPSVIVELLIAADVAEPRLVLVGDDLDVQPAGGACRLQEQLAVAWRRGSRWWRRRGRHPGRARAPRKKCSNTASVSRPRPIPASLSRPVSARPAPIRTVSKISSVSFHQSPGSEHVDDEAPRVRPEVDDRDLANVPRPLGPSLESISSSRAHNDPHSGRTKPPLPCQDGRLGLRKRPDVAG